MVMFGAALRTLRPLPGGNHADKSHHPFILMAEDVAVKHKLAGDIRMEPHEQAHLTGSHGIIRRPASGKAAGTLIVSNIRFSTNLSSLSSTRKCS